MADAVERRAFFVFAEAIGESWFVARTRGGGFSANPCELAGGEDTGMVSGPQTTEDTGMVIGPQTTEDTGLNKDPAVDDLAAGSAASFEGRRVLVEVERASGPGPVVEFDDRRRPVVRRFRTEGLWLGFDHGVVPETDDGRGRNLAALVALPASTFPGCRIEVELVGALAAGERVVLLTALPGTVMPALELARAAAVIDEADVLDPAAAAALVRQAQVRHRDRVRAGRPTGGRAWAAIG
ncbi:MAG: hypothetical protein C4343_04460, partial [Chloroflexota bacterium]